MQGNVKNTIKTSVNALLSLTLLVGATVFAKPKPSIVNIQNWQTKNGASVFFVELHQLPIVDAQILFSAGSAFDEDKPGIAAMTNAMLDEGSDQYNSDQIAEAFDSVGSRLQASVGRDFSMLGFRSLSEQKYLQPTLETFTDILTRSTFPENSFQRVQKQMLIGLQYHQQMPNYVIEKAFYRSIYGNQAYGHPTSGDIKTVQALTPQDLQKFYSKYYVAKNATVVLVGDLTRQTAEALAEKIVDPLSVGEKAVSVIQRQQKTSDKLQRITFPSSQTHVMIGQIGIKKGADNYFPALVGNYVLGGGMLTSRLMKTIREDRGYAYSVYSAFMTMRDKGPFVIELQTRTDKATSAVDLAMKTLTDFVRKGPTQQEITLAKQNIVRSFPLGLASNSAIMGNVAVIGAYQLPLNYLDTYQDRVKAVTIEDVKRTFKQLIQPDQLVTITVGQTNG